MSEILALSLIVLGALCLFGATAINLLRDWIEKDDKNDR